MQELGDILHVDDILGAAHTGAQLDDQVGAAAQRARVLAVLGEQFDRVLQRFWGFVVNRVQVRKSSLTGRKALPGHYTS